MPVLRINDLPLRYEIHGLGGPATKGLPLVLAHGYTASLEMWEDQIAAFGDRYRLILYDCRGHGGSAAPEDMALYSMDAFAQDLRGLLEHLGIEKAYVGGMSMGGLIALHFALGHPQMVRALLLFDTAPGGPHLDRLMGSEALADALAYFQRLRLHGYLGAGLALRQAPDYAPRLKELTMPVLLMAGEQDSMAQAAEEMHQQILHSRLVLLKGAGHGSSAWRPDAFNRAVLEFLAAVEGGELVADRMVL